MTRSSRERVAVLLYGSRGDIQPGVCLALELQRRQVGVTVLVPPNLVDFARSAGVRSVTAIGMDTAAAWSSEAAEAARRSRNPLRRAIFAVSTVRTGYRAFDDALVAQFLAGGSLAEVGSLVVAPLCQDRGLALSERLGIPLTVLRYGPMSENGVVGPVPGLTDNWTPTWKRRAWCVADRLTWLVTGWNENAFRRRLGLPPARRPLPIRLAGLGVPQIQAYDEVLVAGLAEEFGQRRPVVGYLELPPDARTRLRRLARSAGDAASGTVGESSELEDWLNRGEPPVFITFGSMPISDPDAVIAHVRTAARRHGMRCLFGLGERRGTDPGDPDFFYVGDVDHPWILPRCQAIVHHGGAGTTAAALRAGLPMLICSVTADQPFWGARVRELGVGDHMRYRTLTADALAAGLAVLARDSVRAAAAKLSERMTPAAVAVGAAADIVMSGTRVPSCAPMAWLGTRAPAG
ncbi:glycosyltransferase [Gordonia sinesedis]